MQAAIRAFDTMKDWSHKLRPEVNLTQFIPAGGSKVWYNAVIPCRGVPAWCHTEEMETHPTSCNTKNAIGKRAYICYRVNTRVWGNVGTFTL